jgi:hypothetical protein
MEENLSEECGNYISPNVSDREENDGSKEAYCADVKTRVMNKDA